MAEYVKLRYENLYFLGDGVSDLEGAFFEPASVAVHGIELAGFEQGKSAIVIGAGTIGILLAQALTGYGASVVVVSNRSVERLEAARDAGLEKLVNSSDEGWVDDACTFNGGARFDYVFDTAGTPQTILDAFDVAGNKGVVCFVGTPKREVTFTVRQWEMLNRKELTVTGSWMSYSAPWPGVEWDIVNRFFDDGTMKIVPAMVDTIYPLEETAQAFARFADGPKVRGKIVIDSRKESN
jgi:L-iditol 2-dehydrogenase